MTKLSGFIDRNIIVLNRLKISDVIKIINAATEIFLP